MKNENEAMLKLSKKVEYAILGLQYMANNIERHISAKEIAEKLNLSFEFLSKTLQTLMKSGLIRSRQGLRGGYELLVAPEKISLANLIEALDGKTGIVECLSNGKSNCGRTLDCTIREPMIQIQKKINEIFDKTTIAELTDNEIFEYEHNQG